MVNSYYKTQVAKDSKAVSKAKASLGNKLDKAKSGKGVDLAFKQYESSMKKLFKGRKRPSWSKVK